MEQGRRAHDNPIRGTPAEAQLRLPRPSVYTSETSRIGTSLISRAEADNCALHKRWRNVKTIRLTRIMIGQLGSSARGSKYSEKKPNGDLHNSHNSIMGKSLPKVVCLSGWAPTGISRTEGGRSLLCLSFHFRFFHFPFVWVS